MEIKPAVGDTAGREIKCRMIHIRLVNYEIQLERFTRWEKFKYTTRYYKDDLWEFILDFASLAFVHTQIGNTRCRIASHYRL